MTLSCNRRVILTLVALSALAVALLASAQAPLGGVAHAAERACPEPRFNDPKYGYPQKSGEGGYFTSLRVTNTSCTDGKAQMLAWAKCRLAKSGLQGKCTKSKVRNYRCTERRGTVQVGAGDDTFAARVTCKKGSKKIVHTYDQFL